MNADQFIESFRSFPNTLQAAVADLPVSENTWRPPDGAWSILEIVTHLADEEEADFKTRLRLTLEEPQQQWPKIDPEAWATQRNYNDGDLHKSLDRFRAERDKSMRWLDSLAKPEWSRAFQHPRVGPVPAGDLLAAWTAHDWFHLRQICKRRLQLLALHAQPFSIDYAGGTI